MVCSKYRRFGGLQLVWNIVIFWWVRYRCIVCVWAHSPACSSDCVQNISILTSLNLGKQKASEMNSATFRGARSLQKNQDVIAISKQPYKILVELLQINAWNMDEHCKAHKMSETNSNNNLWTSNMHWEFKICIRCIHFSQMWDEGAYQESIKKKWVQNLHLNFSNQTRYTKHGL